MGAPVCLLWESRRSMFVRTVGQSVQALLSVRVVLITDCNRSFVALGLPRMISCVIYEQLSVHLSHGIHCRVSGLASSIQSLRHLPLHRSSSASPCPLHSHNSNTIIGEMDHGGDHGKCSSDEGSTAIRPPY
jgi:hypothetical protein